MAMEGEMKSGISEQFEWNVENEIHLFEAMVGYKPVGIHKHFHMACICEKFETLMGKPISPSIIWDHLKDMYDLAALDKKETVQFPNAVEEFALPVSDFSDLIANKLSKTEIGNEGTGKDDKYGAKSLKEHPHGGEIFKKEKRLDHEEHSIVLMRKVMEDKEFSEVRRGKMKKEEKTVGKRGKRSLKDKKTEEENFQVLTPSFKKGDEDTPTTKIVKKRGRRMFAKRILRSRMDEATNKSSTLTPPPPPPAKRGRRI